VNPLIRTLGKLDILSQIFNLIEGNFYLNSIITFVFSLFLALFLGLRLLAFFHMSSSYVKLAFKNSFSSLNLINSSFSLFARFKASFLLLFSDILLGLPMDLLSPWKPSSKLLPLPISNGSLITNTKVISSFSVRAIVVLPIL